MKENGARERGGQRRGLKITIPEWLAGMVRIEEGDLVSIDNANGKVNLRAVNARPIHRAAVAAKAIDALQSSCRSR
jgi:hypothetical protein